MKLFSPFDDHTFITLRSPVKVYYDVAFSCNLKCTFCYVNWKGLAAAGEFDAPPIEHVERILQALEDAEVFDIVTLGGDLFSYTRYRDFIRLAAEMDFGVGVISNATQITPDIAQELASYVNSCGVSFRGPDPDTFDAITQVQGAFHAAVRGLKALANAGITISLLYDPLPKNYRGLFEAVRTLVEDHGLPVVALQLNRITPEGRGLGNWEQIALPPEAYYELFEQMLRVREALGIRVQVGDAFPFCRVPASYWPLLERCEYGVLWGAVTSRGDVKKCSVGAVTLGNVLERPLTEIWQHSVPLIDYRSFQWTSDECRRCPLLMECAGGCAISTPGERHDQPDYWKPMAVDPALAMAYKAKLKVSGKGRNCALPVLCKPDDRPCLAVRPRFREDTVGVLCVPYSPTVVVEQGDLPWLVVNEVERKVMELCNGLHTVREMSQVLRQELPGVTPAMVEQCLIDLSEYGYLADEVTSGNYIQAMQFTRAGQI